MGWNIDTDNNEAIEQELGRSLTTKEQRFIREVEEAGYGVDIFSGRPAVKNLSTLEFRDLVRETTGNIEWVNVPGGGFTIYSV